MKTTMMMATLLLGAGVAFAAPPRPGSAAQHEYNQTVKLVKGGYDGVLHPDAGDMGREIQRANDESLATRGRPLPKATERAMWRTGLVIDMQHGLVQAKENKAKLFDRYAIFGIGGGLVRAVANAKELHLTKKEFGEYLHAFGLHESDIAAAKKAGISFR